MKEIFGFIKTYYHEVNKPAIILCTCYMALLVWLNYHYGLEKWLIHEMELPAPVFAGHCMIYSIAFLLPFIFLILRSKTQRPVAFWICVLTAPIIFAFKVSMDTQIEFATSEAWDHYWNDIVYWPMRMTALVLILFLFHLLYFKDRGFYGLAPRRFNYTPYLVMLLVMMPVIGAASTQPDFLEVYPKMKNILPLPDGANPGWFYEALFELSYGTDFLSIEIFFRGVLVVGLMKWAGKDAILPMACFYCSIHFGKPLGECISSYFGGLLLGIISYHTRSIYGGLIVHLGIAWFMEIGGFIGNRLF